MGFKSPTDEYITPHEEIQTPYILIHVAVFCRIWVALTE
jgi:hypothetical protein